MKFCIVSCTNRKNSQTRILSQYIQTLVTNHLFVDLAQTKLLEIKDFYKDRSKILQDLEKIHQCQGVILVIPEYNGSFPGIFKYFVDHWEDKTFLNRAFYTVGLGSSRSSGISALQDAQRVLIHQRGLVYPVKSCVHVRLIQNGNITDPQTKEHLETHIQKFKLFAQKVFQK